MGGRRGWWRETLGIGGDHAVPRLGVCPDDGTEGHQAGVVDQGVQASEPFDGLLYGCLGLRAVGEVGLHGSVGGLPDVVRPIQRQAADVPHRQSTSGDPR
jgi:hypothetical protein